MRVCQFRHFGIASVHDTACAVLAAMNLISIAETPGSVKPAAGYHGAEPHRPPAPTGRRPATIIRARRQRGREETQGPMSDPEALPSAAPAIATTETMPAPLATEIRRLTHDLSNALEILVQTSYLLSLAELKEPAAEWLKMLEGGVTRAIDLNAQLRNFVRDHSPR